MKTQDTALTPYSGSERRLAATDRRTNKEERRNSERALSDDNPRRNPEQWGRRATDLAGC